jgi:hypothetical protein
MMAGALTVGPGTSPVAASSLVTNAQRVEIARKANSAVSVPGKRCQDPLFGEDLCAQSNNHEWCATFADWVWVNADPGIWTGYPITPAASSFWTYGHYHSSFTSTPLLGDAVVFTDSYDGGVNHIAHVAIIVAVNGSYPSYTVTSVGGNEGNPYDPYSSFVQSDTFTWTVSSPYPYVAKVGLYVYSFISPVQK